jgi:hypothetical protein
MDSRGQLRKGRKVSMVVLCPTRELARQGQEGIGLKWHVHLDSLPRSFMAVSRTIHSLVPCTMVWMSSWEHPVVSLIISTEEIWISPSATLLFWMKPVRVF